MKKIIENKFSKNWIIILVAVAFLVLLVSNVDDKSDSSEYNLPMAMAAEADNINGYAWSENIGWISFNCTDGGEGQSDICSTSNYGVGIGPGNEMSGYAWSDNVGWISFNKTPDLTGCPEGTCKAELSGNDLTGWARALSGKIDPLNSWDGWISLDTKSSDTIEYGISLNEYTGVFEGYAWGGEVMGWIDFHPSYGGTVFTGEIPIIKPGTFVVQNTITGNEPYVDWMTENVKSCDLETPIYSVKNACANENQCSVVDNYVFKSSVEEETTYTLTCFSDMGISVSRTHTPLEYIELSAIPSKLYIDFVGGSATTTSTSIGAVSYNGYKDDINFTADLSKLPTSPGEEVSEAFFSYPSLTYPQYSTGAKSTLEIFAAYRFIGQKSVPVYGNGFDYVNVIVDAGDIEPSFEEI